MADETLALKKFTGPASAASALSSRTRSSQSVQHIAWVLGIAALGIGSLVIAGWVLDLPALKTVLPHLASMRANTAIGLILGAAGLLLLAAGMGRSSSNAIHKVLAAAVAALAVATLLQYALGIGFGIDQLLFTDLDPADQPYPGRMSVVTAVDFALFAGTLALARTSRPGLQAAFVALGTLGLLISLSALVGYAYGVQVLYQPVASSSIALHTAFAFALLFLGISATRPDLGWATLLANDRPGTVLLRSLLPIVLGGPFLFGWAVIYGERAGYYDLQTGMALFTILGGMLMAAIVWMAGRRTARSEEALLGRQRVFNTIIDFALDAFVLMDEKGRILEWNRQAEKIFGWTAAEATGRPVAETIVPPAHRAAHNSGIERYLASGETRLAGRRTELEGLRRDGTEFPLELVVVPVRVDGRMAFGGFLRDLSDRRRTEAQLRQAQRLEAVGQLTGGVAHDFNNLLTVIIGSLDLAIERVGPPVQTTLGNALHAAERGATLVRQLLAFSRRQTLAPQEVDLNALIEEMGDLLHRTLGGQVEVELKLSDRLWPALTDRAQVETALLNLVINSRDAMPNGGKLIVETANAPLDDADAAETMEIAPGDFVMLAVTDTGSGMPPDVLERVFEPFFSTKEVGKGTGLGLSMVYGFAKQSGGHVKIYSEVGLGTTVRLYLPKAVGHAASETAPAEPSGVPTPGRGETILVVEDSDQVRGLVVTQLAELGYRVLEAPDGPRALSLLNGEDRIDLLFTDVVMPGGMNGRVLADAAKRRCPDLRVLFTSGYTENAIVHHGRLDEGVSFLSKPYKRRDLADMVRRVLDA